MNEKHYAQIRNGEAVGVGQIPVLPIGIFRQAILDAAQEGCRLAAYFGAAPSPKQMKIFAVLANDVNNELLVLSTPVAESYLALTPDCPQAHLFERELAENFGVQPEGHPWLKPVRYHKSYRNGHNLWPEVESKVIPGDYPFFQLEGEEVHEVAVGPIHAGIIEPGHFRFQCHGEKVFHLEIQLGYQHRGVEPAMMGGPHKRSLVLAESIAGDTVIGHASAYCQAVETLAICHISPRAQALRAIALELERIANHVGDLGALANDVGFLPGASYFGRARGDILNLSGVLCGNRYGRGMLRPGGVHFDLPPEMENDFLRRLARADKQLTEMAEMLFEKPSVLSRFENTGPVSAHDAKALGLVGPAARACGLEIDVRHDHPYGIYRVAHIPVARGETGDVHARALVRWLEVQRSLEFLQSQIRDLPEGQLHKECGTLRPEHLVVSMVEGWRGEIVHVAQTDAAGKFSHYKIIDPSFHNWTGLAMALRNQQISDFPLCNKSFNLSYAGHDL